MAAFIIMGGQDNVQGVAGQLMTFFAEVGCQFPQFPFIDHSRGWSAEDMERNNREVQGSRELREGAEALVTRAADLARLMLEARLISAPLAEAAARRINSTVNRRDNGEPIVREADVCRVRIIPRRIWITCLAPCCAFA